MRNNVQRLGEHGTEASSRMAYDCPWSVTLTQPRNHRDPAMAFHLASGKPGPVAKAGMAARGRAPRPQGDTVTSPASGAGSAPDPPDDAPIPQSAPDPQSVTGRAASPAATAAGGNRRLGLALLVIATAQLMVVLDATIVNVALPHVQGRLASPEPAWSGW
jgi:hypothetical protein